MKIFSPDELRTTDVLVVGDGVAGLSVALHARRRAVTIVTKTAFAGGGSSVLAQGGVAAAIGSDDSPDRHAADTLAVGGGLCDPEVVRRVTRDGPKRIGELLTLGARLDRGMNGSLALGREAAHSRHRIVHAAGDATGVEVVRALSSGVRAAENVHIDDEILALGLVLDRGSVIGVTAVDRAGGNIVYVASEVVLATGGAAGLWRHTTNPAEATGDGLAMAIRAGARVADLEFVQFHPTALAVGGSPMPLLTEALRGEGAILIDNAGVRFMLDEHPDAELAPRDVVARAIWRRLEGGDRALLDATGLADRVEERFPTVVQLCREHGFDLAHEPVPVSPAAHYHMGGVVVDADGRTSVLGLWACGEVSRTGLHGANRLASNSLLEALVYGAAVGDALAESCRDPAHPVRVREAVRRAAEWFADDPRIDGSSNEQMAFVNELGEVMWRRVGLERDVAGLKRAALDLDDMWTGPRRLLGETANMLLVAKMVTRTATIRTESRGAHQRTDFPSSCACWRQPLSFDGERMLNPHPVTPVVALR
jgi:L-aspartate oxidase